MKNEKAVEDRIARIVTQHRSKKKTRPLFHKISISIFGLICLIAGLCIGFSLYSSQTPTSKPIGKITLPTAGSSTGTNVRVIGYTKNLPSGSDHVWLVVDKPNLGLCWPKKPMLKPNCSFIAYIEECGPKEPYYLSLYAVNKRMNEEFLAWFDENRISGLSMLPKTRRLDSVCLRLKNG